MYVRVCVFVYSCMCVHTRMCVHLYPHVCTYVCVCVCVFVHVFAHTRLYLFTHAHLKPGQARAGIDDALLFMSPVHFIIRVHMYMSKQWCD